MRTPAAWFAWLVLLPMACSTTPSSPGPTPNPAPALAGISPSSATAGSPAFVLTATGTGFIPASVVNWNGASRTTTFVSATQLTVAIPAEDVAAAATTQVTVTSPAPGGGTSGAVAFTISAAPANNPIPSVATIFPSSATAGGAAFTLTVNGAQFISTSAVRWNGVALPTTFVSATQLTAQVPAANIASAGTASVTVANPAPGGGVSGAATFTITSAGQTVGILQIITLQPNGLDNGNGQALSASITADGELAAFGDTAANLTASDTNGTNHDIFLRETCVHSSCTPSTSIASLDRAGAQPASGVDVEHFNRYLSSDGRFLVFTGLTQDFITSPPQNNTPVVILRDTCRGQSAGCTPSSAVIGLSDTGAAVIGASDPAISGNGRTVTFLAISNGVVSGVSSGGNFEIYARDTCFGATGACTPTTVLVTASTTGTPAGANPIGLGTEFPSLSEDGRYVAFASDSRGLVPNDTTSEAKVFLRDTCIGAPSGCSPSTTLVSVSATGGIPDKINVGSSAPSLSGDGRYVLFTSDSTDLVTQSANGKFQIYLRDTCAGVTSACTPRTTLLTTDESGNALTADTTLPGSELISATGRYVTFNAGAKLHAADPFGAAYAMDTCAGAPAGCVPSSHSCSVDGQGRPVANLIPVAISRDGHYALLLETSGDLVVYLALTGF